ncbi:MAG TPA: hypothetical protein VHN98_05315 [Acidimicrobiales bacterium]|nr:hypothetical protein [Acidimicrobiales bacterium]
MPPEPSNDVADAVRAVLTDEARARRTITYEALLERLEPSLRDEALRDEALRDEALRDEARRDLARVLRAVSTAEDDAGRGLLSAIVVRADTGRPGRGFFRLAAELGRVTTGHDTAASRESDADDRMWAGEVERVFAAHAHPAG